MTKSARAMTKAHAIKKAKYGKVCTHEQWSGCLRSAWATEKAESRGIVCLKDESLSASEWMDCITEVVSEFAQVKNKIVKKDTRKKRKNLMNIEKGATYTSDGGDMITVTGITEAGEILTSDGRSETSDCFYRRGLVKVRKKTVTEKFLEIVEDFRADNFSYDKFSRRFITDLYANRRGEIGSDFNRRQEYIINQLHSEYIGGM